VPQLSRPCLTRGGQAAHEKLLRLVFMGVAADDHSTNAEKQLLSLSEWRALTTAAGLDDEDISDREVTSAR
jgi:hypothetical protein